MVGRVIPKRDTLWDEEEAQAYDRNPIGAGLIKLVEHRQGESMTFERFEDYYHQPANGFPTDHRLQFSLLQSRGGPGCIYPDSRSPGWGGRFWSRQPGRGPADRGRGRAHDL